MKILTIIGARPQFIKAAVLSRAFKQYPSIKEFIVHTGQHYDDNMSAVFFNELGLKQADLNLNIQDGSNSGMLSLMIPAIEKVIQEQKPNLVLVYGDTVSTLAGALAAKLCGIKLAHAEAGMRHGDLSISEELNRVLTDQMSDLLFCSTNTALENLFKEGFKDKKAAAYLCGDLMMDAAIYYSEQAKSKKLILSDTLNAHYVLCTLHRAENVDDKEKLSAILAALEEIHKEIPVILPIHPRTKKQMKEFRLSTSVNVIDPVGYIDILNLIRNSKLVLTDSGGLQKEAFYFKKHTVLMREQTEWVELDEHGYLIIAGSDKNKIISSFHELLKKKSSFSENFYGRGDAGPKVASYIERIGKVGKI